MLDDNQVLGYRKGSIFVFDLKKLNYERIAKLPLSRAIKALSRIRILERILRSEPRFAISLNATISLVSFNGAMYNLSHINGKVEKEMDYPSDMNNPLNAVKIEGLRGFDNGVYFGEYSGNIDMCAVSIYHRGLSQANQWSKVFTFPVGEINHIHNIVPDYFQECVYVLTGDTDSASCIWEFKNNFAERKKLLGGSQLYRACVLFPTIQGFVYATDSPNEQNCIVRCTRVNDENKVQVIQEINGSVIYGVECGDKLLMSTTVEPNSKLKGLKYLLSRKLGSGIKSLNVDVLYGSPEEGFKEVVSFKKDIYPFALCQFGAVRFLCLRKDGVLLSPIAVEKFDNKIIKLNI